MRTPTAWFERWTWRLAAAWRALGVVLALAVAAPASVYAHDPPSDPPGPPTPLVREIGRRVVFAVDQDRMMDKVDPRQVRAQCVAKLLHALGPADEAGLLLFGDGSNTAIPLAPVTDASMKAIVEAASVEARAAGPSDLGHAMRHALEMFGEGVAAPRTVVLISGARMQAGADVDAVTTDLRRAFESYTEAGVTLHAIALGPYATKAHALTSVVHDPAVARAENGNHLPRIFSGILRRLQGYEQRPRVARLDPDADSLDQRELSQPIRVAPDMELLRLDVLSEADESGVVPFRAQLTDPAGAVVTPTFTGVGNAFYRIPYPIPGEWNYTVKPDRRGRIEHHVVVGRAMGVLHYCPSVVELGKAVPLHFSVVSQHGAVGEDRFRLGGVTYHIARAEVTLVDPDGRAEVIRADLQDRQSTYPGELVVARWRGEMGGGRMLSTSSCICAYHAGWMPSYSRYAMPPRSRSRLSRIAASCRWSPSLP